MFILTILWTKNGFFSIFSILFSVIRVLLRLRSSKNDILLEFKNLTNEFYSIHRQSAILNDLNSKVYFEDAKTLKEVDFIPVPLISSSISDLTF